MTRSFPLCHEPAHEERIRRVLDRCVDFVTSRLPRSELASIVLTGSFARGEGSVLPVGRRLRVLGDIEMLVVLARGVDVNRKRPEISGWGPQARRQLDDDVHVDIEFGPMEEEFFSRRPPPSIFLYDLVEHGKVLWGEPDIVQRIRPFGTEHIPRLDALFLLFNRTVEQLEAFDRAASAEGEELLDIAYQRHKLVLDVAGSALAFAGRHCASYLRRPTAFAQLVAETPSLSALLPPGFRDELAETARLKVSPADGEVLPRLTSEGQREWLQRQIVASVPVVARFQRWELEQFLGSRGDLGDLLERLLGTPSLSRRIWDWAKVALHPMPPPLPVSPLQGLRLFRRSTPRLLLYVAAARAYLELAAPGVAGTAINDLLPLASGALPDDPRGRRRAITALWRWCVRND